MSNIKFNIKLRNLKGMQGSNTYIPLVNVEGTEFIGKMTLQQIVDLVSGLNSLIVNTTTISGGTANYVLIKNPDGTIGVLDPNSLGDAASIEQLKLELKLDTVARYKELLYTGDNLTQLNVWEDNTMTTKVYQTDYAYTGDNLTTITITRIIDSFVVTKTLNYDINNNLISIDII